MLNGFNPAQVRQAMKKMGIKQEELEAVEVIIKLSDKDLVITNPQVAKIDMMGQISFQISGNLSEKKREIEINSEDIKTVMEQTNCSQEEAIRAIKSANGDLAKAIMDLTN